MDKKIIGKLTLIAVLALVSVLTIYNPFRGMELELKPGIDLAGGTSLLYEINTAGMDDFEKRELAQQMIRILRKRVDPTGTSNMVWRAHGNDRIEIQMPVATTYTRRIRQAYRDAVEKIEQGNISESRIRQALNNPELRPSLFDQLVADQSADATALRNELDELAQAHDAVVAAQRDRGEILEELADREKQLEDLELTPPSVQMINDWMQLDEPNRVLRMERQLRAQTPEQQDALAGYMTVRKRASEIRAELTGDAGAAQKVEEAWQQLLKRNIDIARLERILEAKAEHRNKEIEELKKLHPDQATNLDELMLAHTRRQDVVGQLDDPADLKEKLQGSGILEFRILPTFGDAALSEGQINDYRNRLDQYGPGPRSSDERFAWKEIRNIEDWQVQDAVVHEFAGTSYVLCSNQEGETLLHEEGINAWRLARAFPTSDDLMLPAVGFSLNEIGAQRFFALTKNNRQRPLCILLDDVAYSAPNIESAIYKSGIIHGNFTLDEVNNMCDTLNAGSLPARLSDQPLSEQTVGPTMGKENLSAGMKAATIGLIAVAVFIVIYYMVPGTVAVVALVLNMLFILGIMALSRSTFTLPGIAGLILTIGMSVDANVLIFERIREEAQRGSSLRMAIKNGYGRALSTIMDANITTFIVALILYGVASEEVKGFAIVLMIGIVCSIFSALYITRAVFDLLTTQRLLKDKLSMMQLIRNANINWIGMRNAFWVVSLVLMIGGWAVFFGRDRSKFSIEFIGGTSVVVTLNEQVSGSMDREDIAELIAAKSDMIGAAGVQSIGTGGNQYEITTTTTNRMMATIRVPSGSSLTADSLQLGIQEEAQRMGDKRLVETVVTAGSEPGTFMLKTAQTRRNRVEEAITAVVPDAAVALEVENVVNDAIREALAGKLESQENLQPAEIVVEPVTHELIAQRPYLDEHLGKLWLSTSFAQGKTDTLERLRVRFDQARLSSQFEAFGQNPVVLFAPSNLDATELGGVEAVVESSDVFFEGQQDDAWSAYSDSESHRFAQILQWSRSLDRVTQIDPTIGKESLYQALVAIILSLGAIIIYIWFRFGNIRFGIAACAALVHDVSIALGLVTASAWLSGNPLGAALLISDFKIDLPMIAAFLTLIGYSLNDTIVIFDRVRENRGKQPMLSRQIINSSINQTLSRTVLTSGTTIIVLLIMYILGGQGLRAFNYALIIGVIIGTYSTVAVAAPLLFGAKDEKSLVRPQSEVTGNNAPVAAAAKS